MPHREKRVRHGQFGNEVTRLVLAQADEIVRHMKLRKVPAKFVATVERVRQPMLAARSQRPGDHLP